MCPFTDQLVTVVGGSSVRLFTSWASLSVAGWSKGICLAIFSKAPQVSRIKLSECSFSLPSSWSGRFIGVRLPILWAAFSGLVLLWTEGILQECWKFPARRSTDRLRETRGGRPGRPLVLWTGQMGWRDIKNGLNWIDDLEGSRFARADFAFYDVP